MRLNFHLFKAHQSRDALTGARSPLFTSVYYPLRDKVITLHRVGYAGLSMLIVCLVGVVGYYWLGGGAWSWLDCLYMVLITITTVGYGEVIPVSESELGLVFTMSLLISGLGVSAYFLSALTAYILEGDLREAIWRRKMEREILTLKGHYIVCGAGEVGHNVIQQLLKGGREVVVIEQDEERLEKITRQFPQRVYTVLGDATEDELLKACGLLRASGLISALQTDRDNLFVVVSARQLNPELRIISRSTNDRAATKITRAGADVVVCPTTIGGLRMASEMMRPTVVGFLDLIVRNSQDNELTVEEVFIPAGSPLDGIELMRSQIRRAGNVLVLSVVQLDHSHRFNPPPDFVLRSGMTLVALGELGELTQLKEYVSGARPLTKAPIEPPVELLSKTETISGIIRADERADLEGEG